MPTAMHIQLSPKAAQIVGDGALKNRRSCSAEASLLIESLAAKPAEESACGCSKKVKEKKK